MGLQHFTIITDHNPLIPTFNSHCLDEIENPRLQRLKMQLMAYNYTAQWHKGSKMIPLMHYRTTLYMTQR